MASVKDKDFILDSSIATKALSKLIGPEKKQPKRLEGIGLLLGAPHL